MSTTIGLIGTIQGSQSAAQWVFEIGMTVTKTTGTHYILEGRYRGNSWDTSSDRGYLRVVNGVVGTNYGSVTVNDVSAGTVPLGEVVIKVTKTDSTERLIHTLFSMYDGTNSFHMGTVHYIKLTSTSNPEINFHYKFEQMTATDSLEQGWYKIPNLVDGVEDEDFTDINGSGWSQSGGSWTCTTGGNLFLHREQILGGLVRVDITATGVHDMWYFPWSSGSWTKTATINGTKSIHFGISKAAGQSYGNVHLGAARTGITASNISIKIPRTYMMICSRNSNDWTAKSA